MNNYYDPLIQLYNILVDIFLIKRNSGEFPLFVVLVSFVVGIVITRDYSSTAMCSRRTRMFTRKRGEL